MSDQAREARTLREIEMEVLAEGREWMRQRLQERLEQEAARDGRVFPPQPTQSPAPPHRMGEGTDGGGRD